MSIIYLDTSALLKHYIGEEGTEHVKRLILQAEGIGSAAITYVEIASAMARTVRNGYISSEEGQKAWKAFQQDWPFIAQQTISTQLVERAASLAWKYRLRGYDSIHLAAAMVWQDALTTPVTLATFDRELWQAAHEAGLVVWPEKISNQ
jgi:predicted nucleic acid-binding protein